MPDVAIGFTVSLGVALMCPESQAGGLDALVVEDRGTVEWTWWNGSIDVRQEAVVHDLRREGCGLVVDGVVGFGGVILFPTC